MKKSFPPFYMNVKHVLFTTSATRFDLFEEIVTLVVYQNECREVFYADFPYGFHSELWKFNTFNALDVVLCHRGSGTNRHTSPYDRQSSGPWNRKPYQSESWPDQHNR